MGKTTKFHLVFKQDEMKLFKIAYFVRVKRLDATGYVCVEYFILDTKIGSLAQRIYRDFP